ncbi:MAG: transposase [Paracoccaceae bacterium]
MRRLSFRAFRLLRWGAAPRQANAKPIFDDLRDWLGKQPTTISGKSPLAQANRYSLTRMRRPRSYLDHGILELDNNTAQRTMRAAGHRPCAQELRLRGITRRW